MNRTLLVPITPSLALHAADLSLKHSLPMADAMVYATARMEECQVITSDRHFAGLDGVVFISKGK